MRVYTCLHAFNRTYAHQSSFRYLPGKPNHYFSQHLYSSPACRHTLTLECVSRALGETLLPLSRAGRNRRSFNRLAAPWKSILHMANSPGYCRRKYARCPPHSLGNDNKKIQKKCARLDKNSLCFSRRTPARNEKASPRAHLANYLGNDCNHHDLIEIKLSQNLPISL